MSKPRNKYWGALKRICRYLIGCPRMVHSYRWQDEPSIRIVHSDSDSAGCRESRKSKSDACFFHGDRLIKAHSKTQANIALSSAEAEYYSMVKAASEGLVLKAMTEDYLRPLSPWMYVDATAAIGVAQRVGLGKLRHLDTLSLWLQEGARQASRAVQGAWAGQPGRPDGQTCWPRNSCQAPQPHGSRSPYGQSAWRARDGRSR